MSSLLTSRRRSNTRGQRGRTVRPRRGVPITLQLLEDRTAPTANLLSYWTADGSAADSWGSNPGTLTNGATYAAGQVNQAFHFDGSDDFVSVGDSASLAPATLTVSFWMNASSVRPDYTHPIARWGGWGEQNSWIFDYRPDRQMGFGVWNTSGQQASVFSTTTTLPLNEWHHVVGTYDGSAVKLYLDGQLSGQAAFSGTLQANASTTAIGAKVVGGVANFPFSGSIDDARVYSGAMSATDVQALYLQRGGEFRVNTTIADTQQNPSVAMAADGRFVVTWMSLNQDGNGWGIYGQRYNAAGAPQDGEFLVNSTTSSLQQYPSVAMAADGRFVVTWESYGQDGSEWGIYGQRYDAAGVKQDGEFLVNTATTSSQEHPSVAMAADGRFVVTWMSYNQDGNFYGIYGQRYNAAGEKQGGEFPVNTYITSSQEYSSVAMAGDGCFVVTWQSNGQDGSFYGIYGQRYDAAGVPQGGEFPVNTTASSYQDYPSVAMAADGSFVVTWESSVQDGSEDGIYGQRYNATGVKQGGEFLVNSTTSSFQNFPSVAMAGDGSFVVTWTSSYQDGSEYGIYGQRYNPVGVKQGGEFLVNTTTSSQQYDPSVAMADGRFVVIWESLNQDGSNWGIYGQRYDSEVNQPPTDLSLSSTAIDENVPAGSEVGTFSTTDPNVGDTHTYTLVAGDGDADNGAFSIAGTLLTINAVPNYEAKASYQIRVRTTDAGGLWYEEPFTVTVLDLDEVPPTVVGTTPTLTAGTLPAGTTTLQVTFSEAMSGGTVAANYTLQSLGADALLGTADDVIVAATPTYSGTTATLTFAGLPESVYRLTVHDTITDTAGNRLDGDGNGTAGGDWVRDFVVAPREDSVPYRWQTFNTYATNWLMDNNPAMYGGVRPSDWTDGGYRAVHMSTDPSVLSTLFTNKGYAGKNALIWSEVESTYSSTNGEIAAALFRIQNTTDSDRYWTPYFYFSANGAWGEFAGVAVNGTEVWNSSSNTLGFSSVTIRIPANSTSTVIFTSALGPAGYAGGHTDVRGGQLGFYNNSLQLPAGLAFVDDLDTPVPYRWQTFNTYATNWLMDNNPAMYGGVRPSDWTDGGYRAVHMSTDPSVLSTLFTNKGYAGKNALIWSEVESTYSSTNGEIAAALFRIQNTTDSDRYWTPYFYFSANGAWGEFAGVAVNGTEVWNSSSNTLGFSSVTIRIPANSTSTVIFTSALGPAGYAGGHTDVRGGQLGFYNNSLQLPAGLAFVDDLDTPVPYRWQTFNTYATNWLMDNNPAMYGGVRPSDWTDGGYRAVHMSTDPSVLSTLFTNKGYAGKNALIWSEVESTYSSTNGEIAAALFRIQNTTDSDRYWTPYFYFSANGAWGEFAGVAVNGTEVWDSSSNTLGFSSVTIRIPANSTSTVIFTSALGPAGYAGGHTDVRGGQLGFYNNSLQLPAGLAFVDDLNGYASTATLASPGDYPFDIDLRTFGAGQLIQGYNNAFDGLNRLQLDGAEYAPSGGASTTDNGRTIITPTQPLSGLTVSREITVPASGSEDFARTVNVFTNPTGSAITTTVRIVGNLGSDAATTVFATSSGDLNLDVTDQWIGTDDADPSGGTPAIIHYIHGPAGLVPTSVIRTDDNVEWSYEITVGAGETLRLAHFTVLATTRTDAIAAATALVTSTGFAGQAAAFLTPDELASLANFQFNQAPTDLTLSGTAIDENVPAGSEVGTFSTTDPDVGDTHTCTLVAGTGDADNTAFTLDGTQLTINASPDYEAKASYRIRVRTTDAGGLWYEEPFIITLGDVNEAPVAGPGGPYVLNAGVDLTLDGSGSFDPDTGAGDLVTRWEWDLAGDGSYEFSSLTPLLTLNPVQVAEALRGAGTFNPVLRVTDRFGMTGTGSTDLTLTRVPLEVTTTADVVVANGALSLREAVGVANALAGVDGITFAAALTAGGPARIALGSQLELRDTAKTTIAGPGADLLTLTGQATTRAFLVAAGARAELSGLTLANGRAVNVGPYDSGTGGAILSYGQLSVIDCTLSGNLADEAGGGISNRGDLSVSGVTFSGNRASGLWSGYGGGGGGIINFATANVTDSIFTGNIVPYDGGGFINHGTATLRASTFTDNVTHWCGGGLFNWATLTVIDCTISGNQADESGGGLGNRGLLTVSGTTFAGNRAKGLQSGWGGGGGVINWSTATFTSSTFANNQCPYDGGALTNWGNLTLRNSTLASNVSGNYGGGIYNWPGHNLTLSNTIVAGNTAPLEGPDVHGAVTSQGYNLVGAADSSSGWAPTDLRGSVASRLDARLAPLADNGGPTPTMALRFGSPAIDAGNPAFVPPPATDQRGLPRVYNGRLDIGAFELNVTNRAPIAVIGGPYGCNEGESITFNASASSDPDSAYGDSIVRYEWDFDYDPASPEWADLGATPTRFFADNFATRSIALRVTDRMGASSIAETTLEVRNVAPTLTTVTVPAEADEGDTVSLTAAASDPAGMYDPLTFTWEITGPEYTSTLDGENAAFVPPDNGSYLIRLHVSDGDGGEATGDWTLSVRNKPPSVVIDLPVEPVEVREGEAMAGHAVVADAGSGDMITSINWDFGDGHSVSGTLTPSHVYADNGTYTVRLLVTDDDGASGEDSFQVTVTNVAPTVTTAPDRVLVEGETLDLVSQPVVFSDPGFDDPLAGKVENFVAVVDWGDGTVETSEGGPILVEKTAGSPGVPTTGKISGSHVYADDGTYRVMICLRDDDMDPDIPVKSFFDVVVENAPPAVEAGANRSVAEGGVLTLGPSTFTDAGTLDTHTATIDWGDGTVDTGEVTELPFGPPGSPAGMSGTVRGSHVYGDNGTYTVTVTVADDHVARSDTFPVVVSNVPPVARITQAGASDAALEFSALSNPAGLWTYGYTTTLGSGLIPYDATRSPADPRLEEWYASALGLGSPSVTHNRTNQAVSPGTPRLAPYQLVFHPGPSGQYSVVRWTAPAAGTYSLSAVFSRADIYYHSTDVHILHNGVGLFDRIVSAADPEQAHAGLVTVAAGDRLDFVLGANGAWFNDTTGLDVFLLPAPAEGSTTTFGSLVTEPGTNDVLTYAWSVQKDGLSYPASGAAATFAFTPADNGTYVITLAVSDDDGGSSTESQTVIITNVAPVTDAGPEQSVAEGGVVALGPATFTDAGTLDTHTATIDWGDGTSGPGLIGEPAGAIPGTVSGSHVYGDDGTYTVTVTVVDDEGAGHSDTFQVVVSNVPPTVTAGSDASLAFGETYSGSFSFADPGTHDGDDSPYWQAVLTFGDGTTQTLDDCTLGTVYPISHAYFHAGANPVSVTVTDKDGDADTASFVVTVGPPAVVYVDDTWAGLEHGSDPDGPTGPAHFFGHGGDAFATVQEAIDAVAAGGTVVVYGGSYADPVTVHKALTAIRIDVNPAVPAETTVSLGGQLTLEQSAAFVTLDPGRTLAFTGPVTGPGGLRLTMPASTVLFANALNDYAGTTTLDGAGATVTVEGALGAAAGEVVLSAGGVVLQGTGLVARPVRITTDGDGSVVRGLTLENAGGTALTVDEGATGVQVGGALPGQGVTIRASAIGLQLGTPTGTTLTTATLTGSTFDGNGTGVRVDNATLTVGAGNTINAGADGVDGLLLTGATADVAGLTLNDLALNGFGGAGQSYVRLESAALAGPRVLQADAVTFDGGTAPMMTPAQLADLELHLRHYPDDSGVGLITVKTNYAAIDNGNLLIVGSNAVNNVSVNTNVPTDVKVSLNGLMVTNPLSPTGKWDLSAAGKRVIVFTLGGNDFIQVTGNVQSELRGGAGNDALYGGNNTDVLYGEEGNDTLVGGNGADVLVGGWGRDNLQGGAGNDLLVGGAINPTVVQNTYDWLRYTALPAVSSQAMLAALAALVQDGTTINDYDTLSGGLGVDGFIAHYSGLGIRDLVTDFAAGDVRSLT